MKKLYLLLAVAGFLVPNIWVVKVGIETGNIMLYTDLIATLESMFVNDISTVFSLDLLLVLGGFMVWSYKEARQLGIQRLWVTWLCTFLFGLGGGFPLFLYQVEVAKEATRLQA